MPYNDLGGNLNNEHSKHDWQLRIAIDPMALRVDSHNNKIEAIRKVLEKTKKAHLQDLKLKMWMVPNERDLYDRYDGTTSKEGMDCDQKGKEICIYLADTEHALSTEQYKEIILTLWKDLQAANIPLQYPNITGDRKITGPAGLPTPFSITSINNRAEGNEEWKDKHGILFKQFKGWDKKHPILKVQITEKDLKKHKIVSDPLIIADSNRESFATHQDMALKRLHNDIDAIKEAPETYRQILFNHDLNVDLKHKINLYNTNMQMLDIDERRKYQDAFVQELKNDKRFQALIANYPRNDDSNFATHPALLRLRDLQSVREDEVDNLLQDLRDVYDVSIVAITDDFDHHKTADNKTLANMRINWSRYIPKFSAEELTTLLEKNPAQMQAIYRRIILLENEQRAHEMFKKQWLEGYYQDKHIYGDLNSFANEIIKMEAQTDRSDERALAVLNSFKALHAKIEDELFRHPQTKIEDTPYPTVLKHFKQLAKKVNQGNLITINELNSDGRKLDRSLLNKKPMSKSMKALICGAIGALVGAVLGFAVGAAVTFWGGSFGALPAAIAGGLAGMTLAQGMTLGGVAAGAGLLTGITTGTAGFFSARKSNNLFQRKEKDKNELSTEISEIYASLAPRK